MAERLRDLETEVKRILAAIIGYQPLKVDVAVWARFESTSSEPRWVSGNRSPMATMRLPAQKRRC